MSLRLSEQTGATPVTERSLAPDLARGFMLLWIALANSHYFLTGGSPENGVLGGFPRDGSSLDAAVTWFISTFVDGRAYPMFGLLFGYGVAQIVRRQGDASPRTVRRLLWRRSGVLVLVGFLHGLLLYVGDILAAYGVLLFLAAWTVRWRDRALLVVAACFFVLTSLPAEGSLSTSSAPPDSAMLPPDLATMFTSRPPVQLFIAVIGPIGFACPFLVGLWAGRRQLLADPAQHRTLLRLTVVLGLGAAVLGAQPVSLMLAGVRPVPDQASLNVIGTLHGSTGVLGGLGYAALVALIAARITDRRSPTVLAITATGQRSMTCYLMQSVVWALVFTPFLLDLSGTLTVAATALLATTTWLATAVITDRMRRSGQRGPFETLIRRITYRVRRGSTPMTRGEGHPDQPTASAQA